MHNVKGTATKLRDFFWKNRQVGHTSAMLIGVASWLKQNKTDTAHVVFATEAEADRYRKHLPADRVKFLSLATVERGALLGVPVGSALFVDHFAAAILLNHLTNKMQEQEGKFVEIGELVAAINKVIERK